MQLAILFWFYKQPKLCRERLTLLRALNPTTPIYGLYGGNPENAHTYQSMLGDYLDNFYCFNEPHGEEWKWYYGDQMFSAWHRDCGHTLDWDTIVIVQWDMLVLEPIKKVFSMLKKNQIMFSGLRPVKEVESWWDWVSPISPGQRNVYIAFLDHIRKTYGYDSDPLCCLFIVAAFPRIFLEQYSNISDSTLGFLEYKLPMYAQIFGIPFCTEHPFKPFWHQEPNIRLKEPPILNAINIDVSRNTVRSHLSNPVGARVFHPYRETFPRKLWPEKAK